MLSQTGFVSLNMGRFICFISFLVLTVSAVAQERYALLIGIGQYPDSSGWGLIHGDNDVVIIRSFLLTQGFSEENITELTNESATKRAIINAFDDLRRRARRGDVVYIHYSGHGQQITDLDGDEDDQFDEAWIPFDANKQYAVGIYEGENHILDDELNSWLNGLRAVVGPSGRIVLVSDACHSGSGTRGITGDDGAIARGTSERFIIPGQTMNVRKKTQPVNWLFVGACKSYQTNYEHKTPEGEYYGSLSYVIAHGDPNLIMADYRDVLDRWRIALAEIARYPQDMDDEGRPSKRSNLML